VADDPGTVVVFSGGGTGGHLYPALALAEALVERRPDVRPVFVGARRGVEARVLPARGVEHILLPVRGFARGAGLAGLDALPALVRSLDEVSELFQRLRPELAVVTGGYAGAPAGAVAALRSVPLVLQEQNSVPGVTTRLLARFARQIHIAFPETLARLPARARARAFDSGNPVRPPTPLDRGEARASFSIDAASTVVLVVGGSQGSLALNRAVLGALRSVFEGRIAVPADLELLWSTGPAHFEGIQRELEAMGTPPWVHARGYIEDMHAALRAADVAVSRAGAMATSEFLAWGLPALLVPLPTAAANHQTGNARSLEAAGAAIHLPEAELSGDTLWAQLLRLVRDPVALDAASRAALGRARPDAASRIAREMEGLLRPLRRSPASAPSATVGDP
jgi:UDP-N-acetylglucosamine--N-acetylmuramyl-(pentapeptide) pyrophosphoryl-undecaprenol N-acetylglucosamine transferase